MKVKVRLDTMDDAIRFSNLATKLGGVITITDNKGLRINAKSTLGMLYALEFDELWCESEKDIYFHLDEHNFVVTD